MTDNEAEAATHTDTPTAAELTPLQRLLDIMATLRDPDRGCPWDKKQTFATIAPYTIEEAYEVADAIGRADMDDLKDELGDLLLQVVYHARIAEEQSMFTFEDVVIAISEKMVRRHPHVFGDGSGNAKAASAQWEEIKKTERAAKIAGNKSPTTPTLFENIPAGLPSLLRSAKLQKRAAGIGFDWSSLQPLLAKVEEELVELTAEIDAPDSAEAERLRFEEFGDLLFILVNLGLHLDIDSEAALRAANLKFMSRMGAMERMAASSGRQLQALAIEEMEELWQSAKREERSSQDKIRNDGNAA